MHVSLVTSIITFLIVEMATGAPLGPRRSALKVLIGNDDGWAEANVCALYVTLRSAKYNTVLSAPVTNQSGTGSKDAPPRRLSAPGQYNSVRAGAPPYGALPHDSRVNYVNSYPVTAIKYGLIVLSRKFFGRLPDIVVAGPNIGGNPGKVTGWSGTVGVAVEAASRGIPAIAFSGMSGRPKPYTKLRTTDISFVYAQAALEFIDSLTRTAQPWMPRGTAVNVNFPAITSNCRDHRDFDYVFTRIYSTSSRNDIRICNNGGRLPTEPSVLATRGGCYATVSVIDASNKGDVDAQAQYTVYRRIRPLLVCPSSRSSRS